MNRRTFNKLAGAAGAGTLMGRFENLEAQQTTAALSGPERGLGPSYFVGTAYYPEWWEPSEWQIDFRQMQEIGINTVRMGEFAWAIYEPSPGEFKFDWMDQAIDLANRHGVKVILGTPTASVPPWLYQLHPDVLSGNLKGPYTYGGRKGYCTSSPNYQEACARIVTALGKHYGSHPGVIGWQLDNEPGYPFESFDPDSLRAFRAWLRKRYGTLKELNKVWNGAFWSNDYTAWSQIDFPTNSAEGGWQPAITLAYRRFFSESFLNHLRRQAVILRQFSRNQFVYTNWPAPAWSVDVFKAAAEFLDATAWDNYVIPPGIDNFRRQYTAGFNHDFSRCAGPSQRFFCAEQMAYVPPSSPEEGLRLQAYINLAHGSHGNLYFEWRRPLAGNEQFRPSFIKSFNGSIDAATTFKQISKEFAALSPVLEGATTRADIAILYSFANEWSQGFGKIESHARPYNSEVGNYYNGLKILQRNIDIIPVERDLSGYKIVVAPNLHLVDDATVAQLRQFVSGGGVLVLNYRAGIQNMDVSMRRVLPPGPFAEMAGVLAGANEVDFIEYSTFKKDGFEITFSEGEGIFHPRTILELLRLHGAKPIATFSGQRMTDCPAVTQNRFGQGWVFYVGTDSTEDAFYETIAKAVGAAAEISPLIAVPDGVDIVSRENDDTVFYFLLNLSETRHDKIPLPKAMRSLLSGSDRVTEVSLGAFDVAVLSSPK